MGSGGITLLADGNYVVDSPNWANGNAAAAGAVTLVSDTGVALADSGRRNGPETAVVIQKTCSLHWMPENSLPTSSA